MYVWWNCKSNAVNAVIPLQLKEQSHEINPVKL